MDENTREFASNDQTFWGHHRIALLIVLSIIVSLILVAISLALYASSGAAQLDLSRPGYRAISDQASDNDAGFENYSAVGNVDQKSVDEFQRLYDQQAAKAKAVDAFSGDPLNPDTLEISAPTPEQ
jgi:hypothetical protein